MSRTVLYNGKVYVDRGVFAEAVLQENGVIKKVGTSKEILEIAGDAQRIDCNGRTVLPGMNDSHNHLLFLAKNKMSPDISKCDGIDEVIRVCRDFIDKNPGCRGLFAMGWNEEEWTPEKKRLPDRHDIDKISTEIPVVLARACGHSSVANTLAMEMAGIDSEHNTMEGGDIWLEEDGKTPSGYLCERAGFLVRDCMPQASKEEYKKGLEEAMKYAVSCGLTSVQSNDAGQIMDNEECYDILREVYEEGNGILRYNGQLSYLDVESLEEYCRGPHFNEVLFDDRLRRGPLKVLKDGSLGARTAMMRHEYYDDPGNYGVENVSDDLQRKLISCAKEHDMQVVTHVIGDEAIERTLKAYEESMDENGNVLRHSLIHCQITDRELMERIRKDDVLIAYQPVFLRADLYAVESRCGKDMSSTSYAFRTAAELGIHASYGTDCPVEDCNPFPCIYCAVTRKDLKGNPDGGFYPEECVDVETAVDAYTIESAYHEFRENVKGRIKEGYYADIIILDNDIFTCDPEEIKSIRPVMTMVGGDIVYMSKNM